jgi:serine/threonine protein kinase
VNVEEIFSEAAGIEGHTARAVYLDRACGGDAPLRERVEALLAAHDQANSFLETSAGDATSAPGMQAVATLAPAHRAVTEGPGTVVGRYKLLQQIGEGGMGVVYMAEQEKPVRRRVALKIIKPGMDSQQVIARFEAERQALAMMDHPNIARVLDAGTTDTGRPYFVMELVQGIPITQYCDDKQLNTRERLELFIHVCNAIQHAHQKGIIHRDLKPSNVLIAIYDARPVPKIIDFGVAKALHQRLTERTMFTQFGAVVGTLEYMSPEQADMDLMGTDTRSDIYSLGVLLYELLTGSTPLDGKKLRSLGYAEMLKTIREVEPPKPSTRLTQSRGEMQTISARRQTEPRRLQKLVTGDLDWIVMKCLEKDRARRYETAIGLAQDIQRHLLNEMVSASPPGQLYKFQKLVRRNKLAFAAVASVTLALLIGLAASLWQGHRAQREAERAERESARASREADQAHAAESQAQTTLNELRATAPSFAGQAQALAANGQFDQAMEKLDYAARLQPDAPELLVAKGDLFLCQLKIPEAAAVYRDALRIKPGFAAAKTKANLCDRLVAAPRSADGELSLISLEKLYVALEPLKRSAAELKAVVNTYVDQKERIWQSWLPRLQALPMLAKADLYKKNPWEAADPNYSIRDDGQIMLGLRYNDSVDLTQLKGLPIAELYLDGSKVTDVQPLLDVPSLESLTVPLEAANIQALQKLPHLKRLAFHSTPNIIFPEGESRVLSALLLASQENLDQHNVLTEAHHNLRRAWMFSFHGPWYRPSADTTAKQFWDDYPNFCRAMSRLHDLAIKPNSHGYGRGGNWCLYFDNNKELTDLTGLHGMALDQLSISGTQVIDLSPLRGMQLQVLDLSKTNVADLTPINGIPIGTLKIDGTKVNDLRPLKGMPLGYLSMDGTAVNDLSPLKGMPLTMLKLRACANLTDLSPLADAKQLTSLVLPPNFTDYEFLHRLKKLERVSFDEDASSGLPDKTTDQFWAELDHKQGTATTQPAVGNTQ